MKYREYLSGVNITWKKDDGLKELLHCRLAIIEEVGEISGWYKKHLAYGRPKEGAIATGLKEEFGDLLYYLTKLFDLTDMEGFVEERYEGLLEIPDGKIDIVSAMCKMSECATNLAKFSQHVSDYVDSGVELLDTLLMLMEHEGHTLEDIQFSNLAKLKVRHNKGFKDSRALPGDRDKEGENQALQ